MHVKEILDNRIMVLDGAMGTMIQQYGLTEKDFRGERFSDIGILQKGTTTCFALPNRKLSLRYTKYISMPERTSSKQTLSTPHAYRWPTTECKDSLRK